jgi:hypothetical protein
VSSVVLLQNTALPGTATSGQTSSVGEPTVANQGQEGREILITGNWYAAKSLDGGGTWTFLDPYTLFPQAGSRFCCDQVVLDEPRRGLLFWLLQYSRDPQGTNVLRLAVKRGTLANDTWRWWDFRPATTNPAWAGEWFDYPDLELGDNFLYMSTNSFRGEAWQRSVVFRLPLDVLADGGQLSYRYFATTKNFSLRCVRGAGSTMYFASHNQRPKLRVFSWPEAAAGPSFHDVTVSNWNAGQYSAPGPDGTNWLARCDGRITGAWLANGVIGLAWSVNSRGARPFPYVRVVEISEAQMQVIADRDIWSPNHAYAFPNGAPNAAGQIGITLFRGGNQLNPGHVVGFFDSGTQGWRLRATKNGTNGPSDKKWGDYMSCRPSAPDGQAWLACGYTLQGGGARTNIEPRVVRFRS